jgi:ABC-type thiamine transport system substrate-binding protein
VSVKLSVEAPAKQFVKFLLSESMQQTVPIRVPSSVALTKED